MRAGQRRVGDVARAADGRGQDLGVEVQTYTGAIPPANPASLVELAVALQRLDTMALDVPLEAPWRALARPTGTARRSRPGSSPTRRCEETRDLIDLGIEAVFAAEPRDLSLLHVLFYIHSAGELREPDQHATGGAQEQRIVGGSQRISIELAKRLGTRVVLNAPVARIDQRRRRGRGADAEGHAGRPSA